MSGMVHVLSKHCEKENIQELFCLTSPALCLFDLLCLKPLCLFLVRATETHPARWSHGCDERLCRVCGVDCPCHEAWLDQSDLKHSLAS